MRIQVKRISINRALLVGASLFLVSSAASNASAVTDTETFTVTVDPVLTITAPPTSASMAHSETDTDQAFAPQSWTVAQNAPTGASVSFSTDQAFTHATDATYKRDAKLDLALASSDADSGWAITVPIDQTDYANASPDGVATVSAAATGAGDAAFNLTVTLVETDFSMLASGDYSTTVTGTLTSN